MIKVILVDDEQSGINVLKKLLETYFPQVLIAGTFSNINDAENAIKKETPDILFLDIHMPEGSGFNLLENIGKINFAVVFVTAYDQYAIKALKMSAADYLLKPINRIDLQFAIEKSVRNLAFYKDSPLDLSIVFENASTKNSNKKLSINKYKGEYVSLDKIICAVADSNYCIIHTTENQRISLTKPLKELDDLLCDDSHTFLRIHKSIIINRAKISHTEVNKDIYTIYLENDFCFQVAKRKKEEIKQLLLKFKHEIVK